MCYSTSMKQGIEKVTEFLRSHHMAVLSTVSEDGKPWGSAIIFAHDEDMNFFFMTRSDTFKYKNIEGNPNVAFTVADEEKQVTVQASGRVTRVDADDYMDVVFKKLASVK